jgi:hypothetical protein
MLSKEEGHPTASKTPFQTSIWTSSIAAASR